MAVLRRVNNWTRQPLRGCSARCLPCRLRHRRADRPWDRCRVGYRRPLELPRPAIGGCRGRSRRRRQPQDHREREASVRRAVRLVAGAQHLPEDRPRSRLSSCPGSPVLELPNAGAVRESEASRHPHRRRRPGRGRGLRRDELQAASAGAALLPDAVRDDALQPAACDGAAGLSGLPVLPGPSSGRRDDLGQ